MAPRRGGGSYSGGSSSSSSSSSNSCSSTAFESEAAKVIIAFHALFFLVFCALFCVAAFKLIRSKQKGAAATIFNIVTYTLAECGLISTTLTRIINIVPNWFDTWANFLLIALIMIPICKRLVHGNRKIAKMVTIVHTIYVTLLGIVLLCGLAIWTHIIDARNVRGTRTNTVALAYNQRRLTTAYYVMAVVGMLMAAANMFFALARGHHLRRGILVPAIVLLILSSLGMTVLNLANNIIAYYFEVQYFQNGAATYYQSVEARLFLTYFFYAATFLMALLVASSKQLADTPSAGPVKHLPSQPRYNAVSQTQQVYRPYRSQAQTQQSNQ
ncbi:hypothetical protein BDV26DRAFT_289401 [Aspergillus bertholletiae]|uniref:Integral membrane protein n=1 Tax=Aspergillus bertholletiae TaxID=1226010 RepID=A0A5N7BIF7_9EURO|nr:hypothetical protein BDV26DRAFT_289401 [Aspergillus bertholletiae]